MSGTACRARGGARRGTHQVVLASTAGVYGDPPHPADRRVSPGRAAVALRRQRGRGRVLPVACSAAATTSRPCHCGCRTSAPRQKPHGEAGVVTSLLLWRPPRRGRPSSATGPRRATSSTLGHGPGLRRRRRDDGAARSTPPRRRDVARRTGLGAGFPDGSPEQHQLQPDQPLQPRSGCCGSAARLDREHAARRGPAANARRDVLSPRGSRNCSQARGSVVAGAVRAGLPRACESRGLLLAGARRGIPSSYGLRSAMVVGQVALLIVAMVEHARFLGGALVFRSLSVDRVGTFMGVWPLTCPRGKSAATPPGSGRWCVRSPWPVT